MSSTRNITDTLRSKLRRSPDVVSEEDRPGFSKSDLSTRIAIDTAVAFPRPHPVTIDVIPDTRFILLVIHDAIMDQFSSGNFKDNAYITPASMTAYCLMLLYGFMLVSDSCYRLHPSPFAEQILSQHAIQNLIDIISSAYVPAFFVPILTGLLPYTDSILTNLDFVTTFACFHFHLDFGRVIPASAFLAGHNAIVQTATNADPSRVLINWLRTHLVTLGTQAVTVNQLLGGYTVNADAYTIFESWFSDRMYSLINPVTSRFQTSRPTFSTINYRAQTLSTEEFNPYLYGIGITATNAPAIFSFIRHASAYSKENFSAGLTIFHICESSTGSSIINHLISGPAIPTWQSNFHTNATLPATPAQAATFTRADTHTRNAEFLFLVDPDYVNNRQVIGYPTAPAGMTQTAWILSNNTDLPVGADDDATQLARSTADPADYIGYEAHKHYTPECMVFNATGVTTSALASTLQCGLLIENGQIDGFGVYVPNIDLAMSDNNAQLFSSAVNASHVFTAAQISDTTTRISVQRRAIVRWPHTKVATHLNDMANIYIPTVYKQIIAPAAPATLNFLGLTAGRRFNHAFSLQQFMGRQTQSPATAAGNFRFTYLWSSYRILENETHSYSVRPTRIIESNRIGFLVSLKHIWGARSLVGRVDHPSAFIH